jgi:hypothetical protein
MKLEFTITSRGTSTFVLTSSRANKKRGRNPAGARRVGGVNRNDNRAALARRRYS